MMTDGLLLQDPPPDDEEFEVGIVGQCLDAKKDITLNIRCSCFLRVWGLPAYVVEVLEFTC